MLSLPTTATIQEKTTPVRMDAVPCTTENQTTINQSIFYFMSVHIEVILDKNKKQNHIIIIYTNFPTGNVCLV